MKINLKDLELTNLSKPCIFISLLQISLEYFLIFSIISLTLAYSNAFTYILAIILIGARQHSLSAIAHDSVHFRISKNKLLNDIISNIFLYFPLFSSQQKYRTRHMLHHKNSNSDNDPDYIYKKNNIEYIFPQSKATFLKNVFKYIFGVHYIINIFDNKKNFIQKIKYVFRGFSASRKLDHVPYKQNNKELIFVVIFNILLLSVLFLTNKFWIYILFWIIPCFLYLPFVFRVRSICEHFGVIKNKIDDSRTMYPNIFDKIFLGFNWNLSYHLDHHLFPTVPSYNLKKLHSKLLQNKVFVNNAQITKNGTLGVFRECTL